QTLRRHVNQDKAAGCGGSIRTAGPLTLNGHRREPVSPLDGCRPAANNGTGEEMCKMSTVTRPCPFCNADATIPPGSRDGQRVSCPRWGEDFVYHGPDVAGEAAPAAAAPGPVRRSNRTVAVTVLGIMALMATVALVYALSTVAFRRGNDFPKKSTEEA